MSSKYFDLVGTIHGREYSDHGQYVTADDYYHLQLYSEAVDRLKLGLEQDLEKLKAENVSLTKEADQLHHECARFRKNSERYSWLRDMHIGDDPESINLDSSAKKGLDAAIDAAIRSQEAS